MLTIKDAAALRDALVYSLNPRSSNAKTGLMPVSMTSNVSCPPSCIFRGAGCYAENWPLAAHWRKMRQALTLSQFCAAIRALPANILWRHNQAGDLPGIGGRLNIRELKQIVAANAVGAKRGFTYTHKPLARSAERAAIKAANASGFTVNLSANTLLEADKLAGLSIGPVVVTVARPPDPAPTLTPGGRRVIDCPATYRDDVSCVSCKLCALPNRVAIVAFPIHGARTKAARRAIAGRVEAEVAGRSRTAMTW